MKSLVRWLALALLTGPVVLPVQAAWSSLYVFGDGVSTTTNNTGGGSLYWGNRNSNGRVWVEVVAQRQGFPGNTVTNIDWSYSTNNWSFFGHYSSNLVENVSSFIAPSNAATTLFVVWVNNADFVWDMQNIFPSLNLSAWTNAINASLSNHFRAITNLYAKGARTLVMPNAVDIAKVPFYSGIAKTVPGSETFIRNMVIYFNTNFPATLNQAKALCPGLTIYVPDFFALLDNMAAHPADYGLIKPALYVLGGDPSMTDFSLTGPGTNYLWWDYQDPTAKAHEIMADVVQQLISPASITGLTLLPGSNRLDTVSLPIGLSGFVDSRTSLVAGSWLTNLSTSFASATATQSVFVPGPNAGPFYRLRFPFAWSWP